MTSFKASMSLTDHAMQLKKKPNLLLSHYPLENHPNMTLDHDLSHEKGKKTTFSCAISQLRSYGSLLWCYNI